MATLDEQTTLQNINSSGSEIVTDNEDSGYVDSKTRNNPVERYLNSQSKRKFANSDAIMSDDKNALILKKDAIVVHKEYTDTSITKRRKAIKMRETHDTKHDEDMWVNESRPKNTEELCIHKKKLEDLSKEINNLVFGNTENKILIVSGPCGSGKSTCVKLLANLAIQKKVELLKQSMVGSEISDTYGSSIDGTADFLVEFNILKDSHSGNSSVSYFGEFLDQCKMLTGLNEKCVVIEELPNLFHKETHLDFQKAIKNWLDLDTTFQLPPLIICVTEYDIENDLDWNNGTSFTIENTVKVETVLGYRLMQYENYGWKRIRFNRVAKTFLKKALNRVITLEKIKKNRTIDLQIEKLSTLGDLRNAINTLEFWYKFQYENKNPVSESGYDSIDGKETALDIFHSIGKIIYGTKHEKEEFEDFKKRHNAKIKTHQVDSDIVTVDNVSNEIMSHLIRFNLCCLENYALINPPICEDLDKLMDILSLSDDIVKRSGRYGNSNALQNVSFYNCLGLRIHCQAMKQQSHLTISTNTHGKKRVIFSRDSKLKKKLHSVQNEIQEYEKRRERTLVSNKCFSHLSHLEIILIDGFYHSSIFSSYKYKYQQYLKGQNILKVGRIGGKFTNSIIADDEFKPENVDDDDNVDDTDENGRGTPIYERQRGGFGQNPLNDECLGAEWLGTEGIGERVGLGYSSGGEIDSDPIEDSSDEDNGDKPERGRDEENNDDIFSDDSAVMNELF